jgi:DNA mismatch endonuclease, patch repair protein
MRAVRVRDTGPELILRRALFARGIRGWRCHRKDLPGTPDLSFGRVRLAVFVDGAFWHGHPAAYRPGQSGKFWNKKIAANVARDRRVDGELRAHGWRTLRIWDHELKSDLAAQVRRVEQALAGSDLAG